MKETIPLAERIGRLTGRDEKNTLTAYNGKKATVPLAVRLKNQIEQEDNLAGLDVLCQRLPFFFQGVAALTGMRCQRENLERWSHWEEAGLVDLDAHKRHIKKSFHYVLILAGLYLTEDNDAEPLTHLLLEPMYWLEEYSNSQKGEI